MDVNEYTLATGFDVSTATYSQNFSVSAQDTVPISIAFNTDGTKMFIVGYTGDDVNEYALSTGFDVSTATYSQNFSVSAQETEPRGIAFNADGSKMFIVGTGGVEINEYSLSTSFDISTASFTQNFSVSSQTTDPQDLVFNNNGTKLFIIANNSPNRVYEYSLATAYSLSSVTFTTDYSVAAQDTSSSSIAFSGDGTKMFILGDAGNDVNEYSLDLTLQLGTGSFASADVGKTIEANSGVFVLTATDGSYVETTAPTSYAQVASGSWEMYGVVYNAADGDLELSGFTSAFDVSQAVFSQAFSVSAQDTAPQSLVFNTDGTKMFVLGDAGDDVNEYTLSTGFDVSTASFVDSFSVFHPKTQPRQG
jgi:SpoU rRNA methylase family enzyme